MCEALTKVQIQTTWCETNYIVHTVLFVHSFSNVSQQGHQSRASDGGTCGGSWSPLLFSSLFAALSSSSWSVFSTTGKTECLRCTIITGSGCFGRQYFETEFNEHQGHYLWPFSGRSPQLCLLLLGFILLTMRDHTSSHTLICDPSFHQCEFISCHTTHYFFSLPFSQTGSKGFSVCQYLHSPEFLPVLLNICIIPKSSF